MSEQESRAEVLSLQSNLGDAISSSILLFFSDIFLLLATTSKGIIIFSGYKLFPLKTHRIFFLSHCV